MLPLTACTSLEVGLRLGKINANFNTVDFFVGRFSSDLAGNTCQAHGESLTVTRSRVGDCSLACDRPPVTLERQQPAKGRFCKSPAANQKPATDCRQRVSSDDLEQ
jgi:hypothetical protein